MSTKEKPDNTAELLETALCGEEAEIAEGAMDAARSKLVMDFGLGQQAPERITIEVLKQLIRENPKKMAYALTQPMQAGVRKAAALLLIVGEDIARFIVNELGEHEKGLLIAAVADLMPVSLEDQVVVLKEFTELFLQASVSLFGDPEFARYIATPVIPQTTSDEPCDLTG